jgi:hypothetical protein
MDFGQFRDARVARGRVQAVSRFQAERTNDRVLPAPRPDDEYAHGQEPTGGR